MTNRVQCIGGGGRNVEINDAKLGNENITGAHLVTGQWVFAEIDRDSKAIFIELVVSRDANTLQIQIGRYDDLFRMLVIVKLFRTRISTPNS